MHLEFQIYGLTGHNGAKAKGCQRQCFDMCCVAQHADRASNPADKIEV